MGCCESNSRCDSTGWIGMLIVVVTLWSQCDSIERIEKKLGTHPSQVEVKE